MYKIIRRSILYVITYMCSRIGCHLYDAPLCSLCRIAEAVVFRQYVVQISVRIRSINGFAIEDEFEITIVQSLQFVDPSLRIEYLVCEKSIVGSIVSLSLIVRIDGLRYEDVNTLYYILPL